MLVSNSLLLAKMSFNYYFNMSWLFISGIYSSHLYSLNICHVSDDPDLETKVDTSSFEW